MSKLTIKQKRFADEYIISGNATEAAIRAGYAERSAQQIGAENLLKPVIKNYIDFKMEILEDKKIAKQEEILEFLSSTVRGEQKEEILRLDGNGTQVKTKIEVSMKDRIKAAELLGKRYGSWIERVDINQNLTINVGEWEDED